MELSHIHTPSAYIVCVYVSICDSYICTIYLIKHIHKRQDNAPDPAYSVCGAMCALDKCLCFMRNSSTRTHADFWNGKMCVWIYFSVHISIVLILVPMYFGDFWKFAINLMAIYNVARIKCFIPIEMHQHCA